MSADAFREPEEPADNWADVRMTDPEIGEWDLDAVVLEGQVEYVDLRVQPSLLGAFMECLLEDASRDRTAAILQRLITSQDISPDEFTSEE